MNAKGPLQKTHEQTKAVKFLLKRAKTLLHEIRTVKLIEKMVRNRSTFSSFFAE